MQLMIYANPDSRDLERVAADDNTAGRMVASKAMRCWAEPTGQTASLSDLSNDDRLHFRRHGWC